MKFLVLDASGMAGHVIALYLKEHGQDVVGISTQKLSFVQCIQGSSVDTDLLTRVIKENSFNVVINTAAILNRQAEERKAEATFVNAFLPHFLAELTQDMPTRIFHKSTDCVFRGNTGPYTEKSFPDGETFYNRSKALGELNDTKNLTIRCSIVGPDINREGIGLFNWFMQQDCDVRGFTRAMWTGLTTIELAKSMLLAAENGATGLVNLVPSHNISKFDLLMLFNRFFRKDLLNIVRDSSFNVDKTLVRTNFSSKIDNLDYLEQIQEMHSWVLSHLSLYPHYREILNA